MGGNRGLGDYFIQLSKERMLALKINLHNPVFLYLGLYLPDLSTI